jgi:hypothetical protein
MSISGSEKAIVLTTAERLPELKTQTSRCMLVIIGAFWCMLAAATFQATIKSCV